MKYYKIKSYCKINLFLKVIKKLNSGYHNIVSLVTFCNLYDLISISKINAYKDEINFSGQFSKGIQKKTNTIVNTLNLLRKKKFLGNQAYKINVKKNVPHGSGLGGGSSNAAALLNYFNLKMGLKIKDKTMEKLANKIGSDVKISLKKRNADIFIQDGRLFAASYSDGVYALDPESGRVFWRQERAAVKQLLTTDKSVVALSADGYAESFALSDGKSLFKTTFPRGAVARPVQVADGLFFSVGGVGFVALNALSGEPLQKSNFGDESFGDLCVLGTRLFSFASSGYVYALDLASDSYVVL